MTRMATRGDHDRTGYWFDPDAPLLQSGIDVLNALRDYRASEAAMRRRTRTAMGMGETDLAALRFLLQAQRRGAMLTPTELSQRLGISTSSTTTLLDRLERSGHVARHRNPADRRGLVIQATEHSDRELRETLGRMHDRMMEVAEALPPEAAAVVVQFLRRMADAVDGIDGQPG